MKQKQETKVTTLCRLVAVYNDILCAKGQHEDRINVTLAYRIGVRLSSVGKGINTLFAGSFDDAIAYMAVRLCKSSNIPRVAVDVMF